ncbi:POK18 protein, partial [Dromaius novaehollandiae]|nr:POK18 protein [Dromaius novaehollandiae]
DAPRFAFSVPSLNVAEPHRLYHWTVLPKGMKNSPTICQAFVAKALAPIRQQHLQAIIYHYMDDILVAAPTIDSMKVVLEAVTRQVTLAGLVIAPEKVQEMPPWRYLGWRITEQTITPQELKLRVKIENLHDLQQLLGSLNWLRPVIGLTNEELHPLLTLLKGDPALTSKRTLSTDAEKALQTVAERLAARKAHQRLEGVPFGLIIFNSTYQSFALLAQWDPSQQDPLVIIEWLFLLHQFSKTVTSQPELISMLLQKGRDRMMLLDGQDPRDIYLLMDLKQLEWLLKYSLSFQIATEGFAGQFRIHLPKHPLFQTLPSLPVFKGSKLSPTPLQALTVFTDGSGCTGRSVNGPWQQDVQGSSQITELAAVVRAFRQWTANLNIVTDSAYVAGLVSRLESAYLKEVSNPQLFALMKELLFLLN